MLGAKSTVITCDVKIEKTYLVPPRGSQSRRKASCFKKVLAYQVTFFLPLFQSLLIPYFFLNLGIFFFLQSGKWKKQM